MTEWAIDVKGLTKKFGPKTVVKDVALRVKRGQIYGFLGPNGSGKTTTIRMLCGLLRADAGEGTCLGYNILTESKEIKKHAGYMPQKFGLYQDLTIRENLDFVARLYHMPNRRESVDHMLESLGLIHRQDQLAAYLSGGWKQRLSLAACVLHNPQLLLLDEPTAGVDPKARREFWDQIHRLSEEGITILVSTHYMDEAERCQEVAYIVQGHLLMKGSVPEVIAASGLTTWLVSGPNTPRLVRELEHLPGVDQIAPFGLTLHISGLDAELLERSLAPFHNRADLAWERGSPSMEDVFIQMMTSKAQNGEGDHHD